MFEKLSNKAGYMANTSRGRVGRDGNACFPTFRLERNGLTDRPTDKASYRVASPRLKSIILICQESFLACIEALTSLFQWFYCYFMIIEKKRKKKERKRLLRLLDKLTQAEVLIKNRKKNHYLRFLAEYFCLSCSCFWINRATDTRLVSNL